MIVWQSVWAFGFFLPLLALAIYLYLRRRERRPFLQLSGLQVVKQSSRGVRAALKHVPTICYFAGLALIIISLARPQRADTKVKRNVEGIDIMVVLDISDSMLIEDMQPVNRLESSKGVIDEFIAKRVSDRIGLVVFSGEAYTRVPLTLDYPLLLNSLRAVKTTKNIKMGTAIGVALATGVVRLKDSEAKSKVMVFLTDGENNSGTIDPLTALELAKKENIKIYSIGVGTDGDKQLPIIDRDMFGRLVKRYQPIHSKINVELLTQFAQETGGRFYRASDTGVMEKIFAEINNLEKTKIDVNQFTRYAELFPEWLRWGVVLYLFGLLMQLTLLRRGP